jgi:hypothetical protein
MFGSLMNSLVDSVGIVTEKIQTTLDDLSEELNEPDHRNIWITIKAINEDRDFVCQVFHRTPSGIEYIRDVTIKEIVDK